MAALLLLTVTSGTQGNFNELDASVEQSMSHVVYPEGDGFVVAQVRGSQKQS